ncbi:MAG: putative Phosphatidylinositol alpha-mannosyltransferase [Candidatus Acidoferrum typicum]|nr:putative Phosphatidylinositol alpha-mannosyltransferase [Candidatus Acidoferrum typicum]
MRAHSMIKVLHIITDLSAGGAETMLYRLLSKMDTLRFENEVISLTSLGDIAEKIGTKGVPVRALGMKKGVPNPIPEARLFRWIRRSKPQIVQTWMYHANLTGGLTARLATNIPVVWGIHHANLDPHGNKRLTIWIARVCASMSKWLPRCVVFCSQAALLSHVKLGYAAKRMVVIPNGLDLNEFRPDPAARVCVREELGIGAEAIVIGIAARFHVLKDYRNFVQAAALLHTRFSGVHFVMCGLGVAPDNRELAQWIKDSGIQMHCHLLGEQRDIARLFSAFDIATSSSLSEAFPLSVGEAMACATPCVVTNVGDSALIVGDTGRVVAPGNPDALATAWRELIEAGPRVRHNLGMAARLRVHQHFALPSVVRRYESIYAQLAGETQQVTPSPELTGCTELI